MKIDLYTLFAVLHTLGVVCRVTLAHGQIYLNGCSK